MAKNILNIMPAKSKDKKFCTIPTALVRKYYDALRRGEYKLILNSLHQVFQFFETTHFTAYSQADLSRIDNIVAVTFALMADPEFKVEGTEALNLIATNHLFCNLVASSAYKTTDGILLHVLRQDNNFMKVLFLYNQRSNHVIDVKTLFDVEPGAASLWYTTYSLGTSNPTLTQLRNLQRHAEQMDERWVTPHQKVSCQYFTTTYLAPGEDRRVKGIINAACKKKFIWSIKNTPSPNKIAIITAKWHRNHAVYKSASPLVNQLRDKYDLTLVHLGEHTPVNLVTEGFESVVNAKFVGQELRLPKELLDNNFAAVYYPDIGMNDEGLWMSNCRIAPIQVMGYGHPATSGDNSEIDYFIGGTCEKDVGHCYAEQMILIPGLAQAPVWPQYERKNNWEPREKLQINCAWGPDKYNYHMLSILAEVSKRAKRPHEWNMFPSPGIHRYAGFHPFRLAISEILPNSFIHCDKEYYDYMEAAEKGDFSVNSYPFGGYNTVIESMFLGLPIITLEGNRYYNLACSYLLREVGMPELSHTDAEAFIECCVSMIDDESKLAKYRQELDTLDLRGILFKEDEKKHFLQAFEYIFKHHPIAKTSPIIVENEP